MLKIYIIDNQAVARGLLGTVLNNGGHEVIGDGNHSPTNVAKMVKLQPQVICVDIGEADKEGLALLDNLRSQLPKSLVFLVSAKLDAPTIQAAQERGVTGFIVKPFNAIAVLTAIRNAILRIATQNKAKNKEADSNKAETGANSVPPPLAE
jgi:two-component system chemotaxis response regulator CheY